MDVPRFPVIGWLRVDPRDVEELASDFLGWLGLSMARLSCLVVVLLDCPPLVSTGVVVSR